MAKLFIYFRKFFFKKREGISIVETLILIVVVAFTVGAILQTSYVTSRLQITGRKYIESHKSMVSFSNNLEAVEADDIIGGNIMDIVKSIDSIGNYTNILDPVISENDAFVSIRLTLTDSDMSKKFINISYNKFSNRTVSDDRVKSKIGG